MFIFNKNLLIIFLSFLGITAANAQVTKVPFKGKKIVISGTFEYLTIIGQADSVIGIQEENRSNRAKDFFDYNIDGETFFLNLKERKRSFMVLVPAEIEVGVTPAEIVFEPYSKDEYGFVDFRNLKGSVEMEGDGYHVLLDNIQSQASVVTYGDIIATLPRVDRGKALSLDTYTGNIIIEVPESKSLNLKSNALKGEVIIDPRVVVNTGAKLNVIAHAEAGDFIKVKPLLNYDLGTITHPELREKIIKVYSGFLDQNKMYPELKKRFANLGFEKLITDLPQRADIQKSLTELSQLLDEFGFPTKEMIGDQLAWSAIDEMLMRSKTDMMEKYKTDYIESFGYYNYKMHKKISNLR